MPMDIDRKHRPETHSCTTAIERHLSHTAELGSKGWSVKLTETPQSLVAEAVCVMDAWEVKKSEEPKRFLGWLSEIHTLSDNSSQS